MDINCSHSIGPSKIQRRPPATSWLVSPASTCTGLDCPKSHEGSCADIILITLNSLQITSLDIQRALYGDAEARRLRLSDSLIECNMAALANAGAQIEPVKPHVAPLVPRDYQCQLLQEAKASNVQPPHKPPCIFQRINH